MKQYVPDWIRFQADKGRLRVDLFTFNLMYHKFIKQMLYKKTLKRERKRAYKALTYVL